ncbi:hypothetical protein Bpro_4660 [Polaromonas sp. JS666]|nr:hypothetical protein Bpro_4660 [Polaromonas sp. JS666]
MQSGTPSSASKITVSLLRSLPDRSGPPAIPVRPSSSLPPSFAPGRFAAFLSSGRRHEQRLRPASHGVDTGFLVFNEHTSPNLIKPVCGGSHLKFMASGLIDFHRDYWDAS